MKRDTTATIFKTVVFAGAMLGAPACSKKKPPVNPTTPEAKQEVKPDAPTTPDGTTPATTTDAAKTEDGTAPADPCAGRIRGTDEDGGGGMGRGFILA